jgi:predicted dehydrogenase
MRLGIIGMSEGNGHPYSWSAICNGYDRDAMDGCGFPAIPQYLKAQRFPYDAIANANVTHVWAQDVGIANHIAKAAHIAKVVKQFTDMIGQVDGVLIARDDAETHDAFAAPFLEAGLPVYVDKPLAYSCSEAQAIIDRQRYPGQLFSCSALRYATELQLTAKMRQMIGPIRYVQATVPKDWNKYAIHVIDPILSAVGPVGPLVRSVGHRRNGVATVTAKYENNIAINITAFGAIPAPIAIRFHGETGFVELVFKDSFNAFKAALVDFVEGALHRDVRTPPHAILNTVELIESGWRCLQDEQ